MRHRVAGRKLTRDTQHRIALRRNMLRALLINGRVVTTLTKAKAIRPYVEKLVTRAKKAAALKASGTEADKQAYVHQVRLLAREVPDRKLLKLLVDVVGPMSQDRPGGYTRILRDAKNRLGDNAPRAIFEFVDRVESGDDEGSAS